MRAAFVGTGWWGSELAAAAGRSGLVEVALACSPDGGQRAAFAARFKCRETGSFEEVLTDRAIEAVVLATPHSLHAIQVEAAARAGKHVFVEKPFTLSTTDALTSIDACATAGVTLAVGHNRRLLPQVGAMRDLLSSGALGTVMHVEANFSTAEATGFPPRHWRASRRECPGGAMTVLGVHVIDWLHALFGPARSVSARFSRRHVTIVLDDCSTAIIDMTAGFSVSMTCLYAAPYCNTFAVHGSKATATVVALGPETPEQRPTLTVVRAGERSVSTMPYVDTLAAQLSAWSRAARGDGAVAVTGREAARNVAVLEACCASAAAGGVPAAIDYRGLW